MDQFSQAPTAKRQIISLLALLGSACLGAALLAWVMVVYYGPTGQYRAENVLLRPETLSELSYVEKKSPQTPSQRFIFAGLYLENDNPNDANRGRRTLSIAKYGELFQILAGDVSDEEHPTLAPALGGEHSTYTISVMVRPANTQASNAERILQQIHLFPEQNLFSIATYHGDHSQELYFHHEGLTTVIDKWLQQ